MASFAINYLTVLKARQPNSVNHQGFEWYKLSIFILKNELKNLGSEET